MPQFYTFVKANNELITITALVISILSLFLLLFNLLRTNSLLRKYNKMMTGINGKNLEDMLQSYLQSVNQICKQSEEIKQSFDNTKIMAEKSLQNVGVVRFNAFDDTGSDLSFAVALLDSKGNGVILTSLFGRNETRTYAKPIINGTSTYHLSSEEKEAINKAMG